jgi:hypothetical protein
VSDQPSLFPAPAAPAPAAPPLTTAADARTRLAALRIKAGLMPSTVAQLGAFSVQLAYSRDHSTFTASVWRTGERASTQTMGLQPPHLETRGRSNWMTGNTWRLSTAGLDILISALIEADVIAPLETA